MSLEKFAIRKTKSFTITFPGYYIIIYREIIYGYASSLTEVCTAKRFKI